MAKAQELPRVRAEVTDHKGEANACALLKRKIAIKYGNDREGYNQGKDELVQRILRGTLEGQDD